MRDKMKPFTVALTGKAAILAAAFCSLVASAVEVKVDFSKDVRPVKPMHAVGQPPLLGLRDYQLFRYLKEAGVPYARLHDIGSSVPHCRYHTGDKEVPLVLELCGRAGARPSPCGVGVKCKVRECRITDETRTNEIVPLPASLPPHSFLVMTVSHN